jgi:hypothetical protein
MHIIYERSGGFTGMTSSYTFNLEDLPDVDAEKLKTLIDQVDFPALPENLEMSTNVPDRFSYTITVEAQEWTHTIRTGDASAPSEIQPLIETLNSISRSQRKSSG